MRYSTELADGLNVENCRFSSFIKNITNKKG